ncbi:MAG: 50S ribosome-binding GTPase [Candidatus Heimdallarchaeota archaeon]|nr:50S ribosome-binding GTPase [Candidatus Heimdallarchaeota archaeon]
MKKQIDQADIITIRTFECELCFRFDSVMLPREELLDKVNSNKMQIGTHIFNHGDHKRIIYYNEYGEYLGDIISINMEDDQPNDLVSYIPEFSLEKRSILFEIKNKMLRTLLTRSKSLCVVGPSYAGKTSLTSFLETGVPERYNGYTRRSPTLHKSTKRISLGGMKLSVFDMGGQVDFWESWENEINKSDKLILVIDGTSNNLEETANAIKLVISKRKMQDILLIFNKYDLVLDGYSDFFLFEANLKNYIDFSATKNITKVIASIFNGVCYKMQPQSEEISLHDILTEFIRSDAI